MQKIFLSKMGTWQYQRRFEQLRMHNKVELYKEENAVEKKKGRETEKTWSVQNIPRTFIDLTNIYWINFSNSVSNIFIIPVFILKWWISQGHRYRSYLLLSNCFSYKNKTNIDGLIKTNCRQPQYILLMLWAQLFSIHK